jgi:hypothetical protein
MPHEGRVRDFLCLFHGIRCRQIWDLLRSAFTEWLDDKAQRRQNSSN